MPPPQPKRRSVATAITTSALFASGLIACDEGSPNAPRRGAITEGAGTAIGGHSPVIRKIEIESRFRAIADAIAAHRALHGTLPESLGDLVTEGSLTEGMTADPWGLPIRYERRDDSFSLRSAGEDGVIGTADDREHAG